MRFALLGDHSDGLAMARALVASGRHSVNVYLGPAEGFELLKRFGHEPRRGRNIDEVLADPEIDAVIIAGPVVIRSAQLRRSLEAQRQVLCVHPADASSDAAYTAEMLATDTRGLLLPILPWALHPALHRVRELQAASDTAGALRLLSIDWISDGPIAATADRAEAKLTLSGWEMLRLLGGEIVEIFAQTETEEPTPAAAILLAGRMQSGALLRGTLLPGQARNRITLRLTFARAEWELEFPDGIDGPAQLRLTGSDGRETTESFPPFDPWPALVEHMERVRAFIDSAKPLLPGQTSNVCLTTTPPALAWLDAIRAIELDENIRRSFHYHRSYALDLLDANEEVSFKGTMTLVGCSLIWIMIVLLILSIWLPWMGWLIAPLLVVFLAMQLLRYVVPAKSEDVNRQDPG